MISGEEEGIFGWISANYLNGKLIPGRPQNLQGTVGALDLGGASAQITFKPDDPNILQNAFALELGEQVQETLYTHSYLYYGINEALYRTTEVVQQRGGQGLAPADTISHPCFLQGSSLNFSAAVTAGLPTRFQGSSNYSACESAVLSLMQLDAPCLTEPKEPTSISIAWPGQSNSLGDALLMPENEGEKEDFIGVVASDSHDIDLGLLQPFAQDDDIVDDDDAALFSSSPSASVQLDVVPVQATGVPYPSRNRSTCAVGGTYQAPIGPNTTFVAFSQYSFLWSFHGLDNDTATIDQLGVKAAQYCGLTYAEAKQ